MKFLFLAFSLVGCTCLLGQTPPPANVPVPTAVHPTQLPEPLSTITPDNTRYLNKPGLLDGCNRRLAAIKNKPCDLIFIGDSITENWMGPGKQVWQKYYGTRNVLDFGIGGDKTQNVLWRLQNLDIKSFHPKVAVILIGTNNTKNTPQEIADGVKAVITLTQQTFSGVKIILVSIMPNKRAHDKMMAVNEIIKTYADNTTIQYLDLVPLMTPVGDNWKGLSKDHLHPDASGYELWASAMEPMLIPLLK